MANPTISFFIQGSGSGHAGLSFDDFHLNPVAAPVPEPSSLFMLGTALMALVGAAKSKWRGLA